MPGGQGHEEVQHNEGEGYQQPNFLGVGKEYSVRREQLSQALDAAVHQS